MEIQFTRTSVYIPDWNGNKKDPNQIKVHLKYLTTEEYTKYVKTDIVALNKDGNVVGQAKVDTDNVNIVRACVDKIENLNIKEGDKTYSIDTASALIGSSFPGGSALLKEIADHLIDVANSVEKSKKK